MREDIPHGAGAAMKFGVGVLANLDRLFYAILGFIGAAVALACSVGIFIGWLIWG